MKNKKVIQTILFSTGFIILFGPIFIFMKMANCFWYGWLLFLISVVGIILIRNTIFWKGPRIILCYFIGIIIGMTGLSLCRPDRDVSLRGIIARESIGIVMGFNESGVNGMLDAGSKFAKFSNSWKAPKGYSLTRYDIDGLPLELLENNTKSNEQVILQLHGGAYFIKFMDIYRDLALKYSKLSGGASVVSIDYRIAPTNEYPAALEDAQKSWNWLITQGYKEENIVVVGDSAGGNLALALVASLRDQEKPLPKAIICMSPWADMAAEGESYSYNLYNDPIFGLAEGESKEENIEESGKIGSYAGNTEPHDKYLSPVYGEFNDFPTMLIQVGTYELIESDSITVYEKATAAGVNVTLTRYKGMFHMFQLFGTMIPESKAAWKEVGTFLKSQFHNE